MPELIESGAGNHVSDIGEIAVPADASRFRSYSQPESPTGVFHFCSQSAVVDDFAANGFKAADFLQDLTSNEHAAAGGARNPAAEVGNLRRRIEQEEE